MKKLLSQWKKGLSLVKKKGKMMKESKFFVLFLLVTAICLLSFNLVFADQEGNRRWCNSDKYGCWVTGEDGGQSYLMFWSESAREYFMGSGSSAPVMPPVPGGEMVLLPAPASPAVPAAPAAPADSVEGGDVAPANGGDNNNENGGGQQEKQNNQDEDKQNLAERYVDMLIESDPLHFGAGSYDRDDLVSEIMDIYSTDEITERIESMYLQ